MWAGTFFALATSAVLALGVFGPVAIYLGRLLAGITAGTAMAVGTSWLKELSQAPFDPTADAGSGVRQVASNVASDVVFDRCGHSIALEAPDRRAQHLTDFMFGR